MTLLLIMNNQAFQSLLFFNLNFLFSINIFLIKLWFFLKNSNVADDCLNE